MGLVRHGDVHSGDEVSARGSAATGLTYGAPPGHAIHGPRQRGRPLLGSRAPDAFLPGSGEGHQPSRPAGEEGSALILVDSSGWIEYLAGGPRADRFAPYLEGRESLLVSAIVVYEVD